jgi:Rrf2 family protein
MKLSPAAALAIRGAVVLAEEYGQGPIPLGDICSRRDLPKQYLVKIFSSLARAGLISPIRGQRGGYILARDPDRISLLQVIEAVEGPIALNYCQQTPSQCDRTSCPMRPLWTELQQTLSGKLNAMTLADCVYSSP